MGECLAKNMIKEANFSKFFSESSQMMQKLGRNIPWIEILWIFLNDDVIFNSNVWCHNRHFDVVTTKEVESGHCFFVFGWIKLKFAVKGNFRLNLNSKTQYQFEILRKSHFSSLRSLFLAQHSLTNWLSWQQWMTYLQPLNFKIFYTCFPKNDIGLVKINWTVFEIFSQNPRKPSTF